MNKQMHRLWWGGREVSTVHIAYLNLGLKHQQVVQLQPMVRMLPNRLEFRYSSMGGQLWRLQTHLFPKILIIFCKKETMTWTIPNAFNAQPKSRPSALLSLFPGRFAGTIHLDLLLDHHEWLSDDLLPHPMETSLGTGNGLGSIPSNFHS